MSKRRSFSKGDRVAVTGYTPKGSEIESFYGTVEKRLKGGWLRVRWDCRDWSEPVERVHSRMCRRLRKRAGRRVWINPKVIPQALGAATVSSGSMRLTSRGPVKGWIEFREVRKRKESP